MPLQPPCAFISTNTKPSWNSHIPWKIALLKRKVISEPPFFSGYYVRFREWNTWNTRDTDLCQTHLPLWHPPPLWKWAFNLFVCPRKDLPNPRTRTTGNYISELSTQDPGLSMDRSSLESFLPSPARSETAVVPRISARGRWDGSFFGWQTHKDPWEYLPTCVVVSLMENVGRCTIHELFGKESCQENVLSCFCNIITLP